MERVASAHRRGAGNLAHGNVAALAVPPVLNGPLAARAHHPSDAKAAQELGYLIAVRAREERGREVLRHDGDVDEAQQGSEPVLPRAAVEHPQVRRASLKEGEGVLVAFRGVYRWDAQHQRRVSQRRVMAVDEDDADPLGQLGRDARRVCLQSRVRGGDHAPAWVFDDRGHGRFTQERGRGCIR